MPQEKSPEELGVGAVAVSAFLSGGSPSKAVSAHKKKAAIEVTPAITEAEVVPSIPMPEKPAKAAEPAEVEEDDADREVAAIQRGVEYFDAQIADEEKAADEFDAKLRALKLTKKEAWAIIDRLVIQNQPWSEKISLMSMLSIEFRTRDQSVIDRLNEEIEKQQLYTSVAVNYEQRRLNLAASIMRFGGHRFDPEDMEARLAWARGLQGPVYHMLTSRLYEFDQKIAAVLEKGFMANF